MKKVLSYIVMLCCFFCVPYIITNIFSRGISLVSGEEYILGRRINVQLNNVKKTMALNDFVTLVLAERINETDEDEVIKAMSIMIRTDVCRIMKDSLSIESEELGMDYMTPNDMKVEWGDSYSERYKHLEQLCKETNETIITYGGKPIDARYTRLSCGKTLSGKELLGDEYNYLQGVECSEDALSNDFIGVKVYGASEWIKLFKKHYSDIDIDENNPAKDVSAIAKTTDGYMLKVQVGNMIMSGEKMAQIIGANSSCMSVEEMDGSVKVVTKGIGSGYGLSINSANLDAQGGMNYEEIIKKYYSEVEVSK